MALDEFIMGFNKQHFINIKIRISQIVGQLVGYQLYYEKNSSVIIQWHNKNVWKWTYLFRRTFIYNNEKVKIMHRLNLTFYLHWDDLTFVIYQPTNEIE